MSDNEPKITHIGDLTPDPNNARLHNPRNVGMIADGLGQVGAARSIVIDENGVILAGNATIEAAAQAGIERVQVVEADGETIIAVRRIGLSDEQKKKLALLDNRTAELADWNPEQLLADLEAGVELDDLWYEGEIEELLADVREPEPVDDPGPQIDRAAELQAEWGTERGQIWEIPSVSVPGKSHRILCGDSTDADDVARLMDGEKAEITLTDPPYNVGLKYTESFDDNKGSEEYKALSSSWFFGAMGISARVIFTPGSVNLGLWFSIQHPGHVGCWFKTGDTGGAHGVISQFQSWEPILFYENKDRHHERKYLFTEWLKGTGISSRQINTITDSFMGGHYLTEKSQPAIPTKKMFDKMRHLFATVPKDIEEIIEHRIDSGFGRVRHSDVFNFSAGVSTTLHSCPKPLELWIDLVGNYSDKNKVIFDPFLGSGTTLIAAESCGRVCYGVEIDPGYVAVSLQRLQDMGLQPTLTKAD